MSDTPCGQRCGTLTRRQTLAAGVALFSAPLAANLTPAHAAPLRQATPVPTTPADPSAALAELAEAAMESYKLQALLMRVVLDGEELITTALGETMTGVPATADMHFRNGAVAITYMSTIVLQLVDEGVVTLDDPLANWLPELPDSANVTLRQLMNMTAGYPDFVRNTGFQAEFYANPFRAWTPEQQIAISLSTPRIFAPGTNWDYSHSNYVILGQAIQKITGQSLHDVMQERILTPLGLTQTQGFQTAEIPAPVLHSFSSERRDALGIPAGTPFIEDSTFWNPSWTLAEGAVQISTITDMATSAIAFGEGTLLSPESHQAQISPDLIGFGKPLQGCPACHTLDANYSYGLGIVINHNWLLQNPLFAGCGSVAAYLPSRKLAVAIATTFTDEAFADDGSNKYDRASASILVDVAKLLAPDDLPAPRAT